MGWTLTDDAARKRLAHRPRGRAHSRGTMSTIEAAHPAQRSEHRPSADDLIARARQLAPKLRERAVRAERERNVPLESVQEYIDAGLLRTLIPHRWGGYEH